MKKITFILLLLVCSFTKAFATDYYTSDINATISPTSCENWTLDPTGLTGYGSFSISSTDNFIVLSGGVATNGGSAITTIGTLTINQGGTFVKTNGQDCVITGLLTWNGTIKSTSGWLKANGGIVGTDGTAMQDPSSTRDVYMYVSGTINLKQASGSSTTNGIQIAANCTLSGDCVLYGPFSYNNTVRTLDLNGYNLQVGAIRNGGPTNLVKGNSLSTLSLSGGTSNSIIYFTSGFETLAGLNIDNALSGGTPTTTINGNLTVDSLKFGVPTGTSTPRTLNVIGDFTLANNGTMRVQAQGSLFGPGTDYDQIAVNGNVTLGTDTTLKIDYINGYSPANGTAFDFGTYTGTKTGTFTTITSGTSGNVTYASQNITYTTSSTLSVEKNTIAQGIQLYPNPIVDVLNISAPGATAAISVQVLDLSGKKVASAKSKTTSATVSLSNATAGIYLVKVTDGTSTYTQKVIKK